MPSGPQSRAKHYAFFPEPARAVLLRAGWDDTMLDVSMRLINLEARDANYEEVVDQLRGQALAVITNSLTTEIGQSRAQLAELREAYDEIEADGIRAARILVTAIPNFPPANVQAALAELVARTKAVTDNFSAYTAAQRQITGAAIFFAGN